MEEDMRRLQNREAERWDYLGEKTRRRRAPCMGKKKTQLQFNSNLVQIVTSNRVLNPFLIFLTKGPPPPPNTSPTRSALYKPLLD